MIDRDGRSVRQDAAPRAPVVVQDSTARPIPVVHLNITATTSGGAQTFYTTNTKQSSTVTECSKLTVTNKSGSAATLTLHTIPSGDAIGDTNKELDAFNVPANSVLRLDGLLGGAYAGGTAFKVYSGTNGALVLRGAFREWR